MRTVFVIVFFAFSTLSGCVSWPKETVMEESSWLVFQSIDGVQTADIAHVSGDFERESAWAIGRRPSVSSTVAYFAVTAAIHLGATEYMTAHHWPRWAIRGFEAVTIADSARCVVGNEEIGLRP